MGFTRTVVVREVNADSASKAVTVQVTLKFLLERPEGNTEDALIAVDRPCSTLCVPVEETNPNWYVSGVWSSVNPAATNAKKVDISWPDDGVRVNVPPRGPMLVETDIESDSWLQYNENVYVLPSDMVSGDSTRYIVRFRGDGCRDSVVGTRELLDRSIALSSTFQAASQGELAMIEAVSFSFLFTFTFVVVSAVLRMFNSPPGMNVDVVGAIVVGILVVGTRVGLSVVGLVVG
jgi:hypothetical protein